MGYYKIIKSSSLCCTAGPCWWSFLCNLFWVYCSVHCHDIDIVMQPSSLPISRAFSSSQTETWQSLINNPASTPLHHSTSVSAKLTHTSVPHVNATYSICPFVTAHFTQHNVLPSSQMLERVSEFPSFLRLSSIPLYGLTTLYSSISGITWVWPLWNNAAAIWTLRHRDINSHRRVEWDLNPGSLAPDSVS